jgi:hypothetical protein
VITSRFTLVSGRNKICKSRAGFRDGRHAAPYTRTFSNEIDLVSARLRGGIFGDSDNQRPIVPRGFPRFDKTICFGFQFQARAFNHPCVSPPSFQIAIRSNLAPDLICSGFDTPESPANSEQLQNPRRTPAMSSSRRYCIPRRVLIAEPCPMSIHRHRNPSSDQFINS